MLSSQPSQNPVSPFLVETFFDITTIGIIFVSATELILIFVGSRTRLVVKMFIGPSWMILGDPHPGRSEGAQQHSLMPDLGCLGDPQGCLSSPNLASRFRYGPDFRHLLWSLEHLLSGLADACSSSSNQALSLGSS